MSRKLYKLLLFRYWQKHTSGSPFVPEKYSEALHFANEAHLTQRMPDGKSPYLLHLTEVAMEVGVALQLSSGLDGNLAIQCALLHDTVEDTSITLAHLTKQFGEAVASGVWALTKDEKLPKNEQMHDSLAKLKQQPIEVQIVKLADRIVNLQEPPTYWDITKRKKYQEEAMLILEELEGANLYLEKRLAQKIQDYEQFCQ